jgi:hypothetical protein
MTHLNIQLTYSVTTFNRLRFFFIHPPICFKHSALPSIHVAEYTFANPPSPICFISSNLSNGTHSRNLIRQLLTVSFAL